MIAEKNSENLCYDFHCHSLASDGALAAEDLVMRAQQQGVDVLAITDHDTVSGYRSVIDFQSSVRLISGVEFSSRWNKRGVHIVGLGMQVDHPVFAALLDSQAALRLERAELIAAKLEKLGFSGLLDDVSQFDAAQLGRPMFAKKMVEKGWVKDESQAFAKYLGAGKVGDISLVWPSMATVVSAINSAGGVAVLAHPMQYRLTLTKLREILTEFVACGGKAMEVSSGMLQKNQLQSMADLANRFELFASIGSDFHAPAMHWRELGKSSPLPKQCRPIWQALNL